MRNALGFPQLAVRTCASRGLNQTDWPGQAAHCRLPFDMLARTEAGSAPVSRPFANASLSTGF